MKQALKIGWKFAELWIWILAILYLGFINPSHEHMNFCIYHWTGLTFCPGCGIGSSISWLLHINIKESFSAHPLGIPAFMILTYRISQLSLQFIKQLKNQNYGLEHAHVTTRS